MLRRCLFQPGRTGRDGYLANEAERKIVVTVCNGSFQPVYNAVISMGAIQGGAPELITGDDAVPIGTLLPGKYQVEVSKPTPGMCAKFNASLGFTDSKGLSWARDAKGKLFQIDEHLYDYFELSLPVGVLGALAPVHGD